MFVLWRKDALSCTSAGLGARGCRLRVPTVGVYRSGMQAGLVGSDAEIADLVTGLNTVFKRYVLPARQPTHEFE